MKKALVATIIAAVLILFGGILFFVCGSQVNYSANLFGLDFYGNEEVQLQTFDVTDTLKTLNVSTNVASIELIKSEDGSRKVVYTETDQIMYNIGYEDGVFDMKPVHDVYFQFSFLSFNFSLANYNNLYVKIYLPEKELESINFDTDTGKITVNSGFEIGQATCDSDTGAVYVKSDVKNKLYAETDMGRIEISGINAGDVEIEENTGSVTLSDINVEGKIKIESDTGSVTLKDTKAGTDIDIEVDTGSIEFERIDAKNIKAKADTGSIKGTILSEKQFSAKSSTGTVIVPASAGEGTCDLKTSTGSIKITIAD